MSQEHANSYTVDTGGLKQIIANITGDKHYRSTAQKVVDLQQLALQLKERVRISEAKHKKLVAHVHDLQEYLKTQQEYFKTQQTSEATSQRAIHVLQTIAAKQEDQIRDLQRVVLRIGK